LDLLILAFGTIHVLATSAWFGAMLYRLVVLQPRAMLYFDRPEEFENFIAVVSDGARWKVLAVAGLSALSGVGIAVVTWPEENQRRGSCLAHSKLRSSSWRWSSSVTLHGGSGLHGFWRSVRRFPASKWRFAGLAGPC
jgi:hypothetical protein